MFSSVSCKETECTHPFQMTMLQIPLLLKDSIDVSSPFALTAVLQVCYSNIKSKDGIFQPVSGPCRMQEHREKLSLGLLFSSCVVHLEYMVEKSYMCLWSTLYYSHYTVPAFGRSSPLQLFFPFLLSAPGITSG